MGIYLNPGNDLFTEAANSEIYVDKTMMIEVTNQLLGTSQKEICVSRPRRFGKSIAENMLVAYYSKGCDSDAHNENVLVIKYNDENSLACVLTLAYYSAQDTYALYRELQGGEGFADLVFVPRQWNTNPAMIIELKWDKNAGIALEQIKDRQYVKCLKDYHGQVLFVGINYDKKSKKHECRFESIVI